MAFSFQRHIGSINATNSTSVQTIAVGASGVPAGAAVVVFVSRNGGSISVADDGGNTYTLRATGTSSLNGIPVLAFTAILTTELVNGDNISVTYGTGFSGKLAHAYEFRAAGTISYVTAASANSSFPHSAPSNAGNLTVEVGDLIVAGFIQDTGSAVTWTEGTDFTALETLANGSMKNFAEYDLAAGSTSVTPQASSSVSASWAGASVAFHETVSGTTHERSASLSATGTVTAAAHQRDLNRQVALSAAGTVTAAAFQRDHNRQVAVAATGSIATAGQRDLHRQASLDATATITTAGETDHNRAAALTATATIATAGQTDHNRQASLAATGTITATGQIEGQATTHERSASLTATSTITATNRQVDHNRQATLTATGTVTTSGLLIHQRQAAVAAAGTIDVAAFQRDLNRQLFLAATGLITTSHQRDHNRQVSLTATATINTRPFTGRAWTYDNVDTATYNTTPDFTYDGENDWTYTPVS